MERGPIMASETVELNVALEKMLSGRNLERASDTSSEFDLRTTLSDTVVRETGYAEFLAALRQSGCSHA
jgi:hypothetical protein